MYTRTLRRRVRVLEGDGKENPLPKRVIFSTSDMSRDGKGIDDHDIIGTSVFGMTFDRLPGESLEAMFQRTESTVPWVSPQAVAVHFLRARQT